VVRGPDRHGAAPAGEALLEGAGNFGTPAEPLALPWFTACRLTGRGELVAEELLAQHPGYRPDAEPGAAPDRRGM
jgi:hypothetical protein